MGRSRLVPDVVVYQAVRSLLAQGGSRAVSFGTVATHSGLSAPSLVQRYGSRDGMVHLALIDGWEQLETVTDHALQDAPKNIKGAVGVLKALSAQSALLRVLMSAMQDPVLSQRAADWRAGIVLALSTRLGGSVRDTVAGEMLFAAWYGRMIWSDAGVAGFKLRSLAKTLSTD